MYLHLVFSDWPTYLNGVSEALFKNGLCLTSGSDMTDEERERVVVVLLKTLGRRQKSVGKPSTSA